MAHLIKMDDLGYRTFTNPWITIVGAEPIVWLFGGQVGLTIAGKKKNGGVITMYHKFIELLI